MAPPRAYHPALQAVGVTTDDVEQEKPAGQGAHETAPVPPLYDPGAQAVGGPVVLVHALPAGQICEVAGPWAAVLPAVRCPV